MNSQQSLERKNLTSPLMSYAHITGKQTTHTVGLCRSLFPWSDSNQMWRLYCTYSSHMIGLNDTSSLTAESIAEISGSNWVAAGWFGAGGGSHSCSSTSGRHFVLRERGRVCGSFYHRVNSLSVFLVIIFQNLVEIGTISHRFQSVTGESTGLGNAHLTQAFMFAVRRKKNEPSRPGLLLLYYSEELWEWLNGGGARRGSENTTISF